MSAGGFSQEAVHQGRRWGGRRLCGAHPPQSKEVPLDGDKHGRKRRRVTPKICRVLPLIDSLSVVFPCREGNSRDEVSERGAGEVTGFEAFGPWVGLDPMCLSAEVLQSIFCGEADLFPIHSRSNSASKGRGRCVGS